MPFTWPQGAKAALSFSFDDGRATQISQGIPLLNDLGLKATFYLNPSSSFDAAPWLAAQQAGHEIGNHTCLHPCSGNFGWVAKDNRLEDFDLPRMEAEILECSRRLESSLASRPSTFAYPCGHDWVGRGAGRRSMVPLVAKHFLAGRAYRSEHGNDPSFCDLSALAAQGSDGATFESLRTEAGNVLARGHWLILAGHEMADEPGATGLKTVERLAGWLKENGFWVDTVTTVAAWVQGQRANGR